MDALHDAVRGIVHDGEIPESVVVSTRALAMARCRAYAAAQRLTGQKAHALLAQGIACEIVFPHRLPLAWATATIEAGSIRER